MSTPTPPPGEARGRWYDLPAVSAGLAQVEAIIAGAVRSRQDVLTRVGSELVESGGKRLRPTLVLLGATFGERRGAETERIAAAVELLHMATLVHDDIIDDSPLRRGQPTAQARYGKDIAVFAGDFLLAKSLLLLSPADAGNSLPGLARAMVRICEGEVGQYSSRFVLSEPRSYLRRIRGKTAALFAISAAAGARHCEARDEDVRALARYGLWLGMAFQIHDDLLDYGGDSAAMGKPTRHDLLSGVYTLPLLLSLAADDPLLRELAGGGAADTVAEIITAVRDRGGPRRAAALMTRYVAKALGALKPLPDGPAKTALAALPERLLRLET